MEENIQMKDAGDKTMMKSHRNFISIMWTKIIDFESVSESKAPPYWERSQTPVEDYK